MKEPAPLPFLARPGYRRRRLIEAIRLMPYAWVLAVLFPLLWPDSEGAPELTSHGAVYLFSAWALLILAAAAGVRALRRTDRRPAETEDADGARR